MPERSDASLLREVYSAFVPFGRCYERGLMPGDAWWVPLRDS